jgi:valyl-tRNA synthetase
MTEPLQREIPKVYDPKACEEQWSQFWQERNQFHTNLDSPKPKYSIVIPPPNVTGRLHMGHALNNTIQDILCRYKRLSGYEVIWMPGTDHAGIATQSVVERQMFEREKIYPGTIRAGKSSCERIWKWREQLCGAILGQLKALALPAIGTGCALPWMKFARAR